ncbi:hypothetical protein [Nannocystis pusilla]|uniref:hypothetical protein n=1 Tax=Nannocystis pusilla TaxID=889268 RepID=UPI003DA4BE86
MTSHDSGPGGPIAINFHLYKPCEGFEPVAEDNAAMTDSYAMLDPLGRFYGNHGGRHLYSAPILEVGVQTALRQSRFSPVRLVARGGKYAW